MSCVISITLVGAIMNTTIYTTGLAFTRQFLCNVNFEVGSCQCRFATTLVHATNRHSTNSHGTWTWVMFHVFCRCCEFFEQSTCQLNANHGELQSTAIPNIFQAAMSRTIRAVAPCQPSSLRQTTVLIGKVHIFCTATWRIGTCICDPPQPPCNNANFAKLCCSRVSRKQCAANRASASLRLHPCNGGTGHHTNATPF